MNEREQRGLAIAATCKIQQKGGVWLVPSQTTNERYTVCPDADNPHCTCPDHETRGVKCKHIFAVEFTIRREQHADGSVTETVTRTVTETIEIKRKTYRQDWPAYNRAQTTEKAQFQVLLHDLCRTIPEPERKAGKPGPEPFRVADIVFSAAFKVYSTFSGRRFMTDLKEAHSKGYTDKLLHYNSIFRYLEMPTLTPILKELVIRASLPLKSVEQDFAVDSSGFSTCKFDRWFDEKYGKERKLRTWIKAHLMCGVKTNVVTAVEIEGQHANDYPMFAPLVKTTAQEFAIDDVDADKAYLGNSNFELVDSLGGTMFVPFKVNSSAGEGGSVWNRMFAFWQFHREDFLRRYHQRSKIESTFSMVKRKYGDSVRSKCHVAQVNEVLCKLLCHNICVINQEIQELGIAANFGAEMASASSSLENRRS